MSVEEAILEKVRALPPQKREEVLKFADSLRGEANADDAEEHSVEEARQWLRENGGKGIPHEVVLADFGLTMDDFRRMAEERARFVADPDRKRIDWTPQARADVRRIDRETALRLLEDPADYAASGYGDVERLTDIEPPELRLRLGDNRIRFYDHGEWIQILRVVHRREAYR